MLYTKKIEKKQKKNTGKEDKTIKKEKFIIKLK